MQLCFFLRKPLALSFIALSNLGIVLEELKDLDDKESSFKRHKMRKFMG